MASLEQCRNLVLLERGGCGKCGSRSLDLDGKPGRNIWRQDGIVNKTVALGFFRCQLKL